MLFPLSELFWPPFFRLNTFWPPSYFLPPADNLWKLPKHKCKSKTLSCFIMLSKIWCNSPLIFKAKSSEDSCHLITFNYKFSPTSLLTGNQSSLQLFVCTVIFCELIVYTVYVFYQSCSSQIILSVRERKTKRPSCRFWMLDLTDGTRRTPTQGPVLTSWYSWNWEKLDHNSNSG